MINSILNFNFWLEAKTESKPKEERTLISKIILNGFKLVCRFLVFSLLWLKGHCRLIKISPLQDDGKGPIVSLTSYPKRMKYLWMVLYCIYKQSIRPSKIVVTLIKDEIGGGLDSISRDLKFFKDKGVEFLFEEKNLKPHNKYFYVRQKYPNRNIITIDDDLLYYSDTIERLLEMHQKHPECICSNRIQEVGFENGTFTHSNYWRLIHHEVTPSHKWLGLGYSAVLYPPSFYNDDLYNISKIEDLCLMADDMWLKIQELRSDVMVVNGKYFAHPMTLPSSQGLALQHENNAADSRNDKYLKLLSEHYKTFFSKFSL